MNLTIELITPEIAAKMLEANSVNRPLRKQHIEQLARALTAGEWQVSPQGLAFAGSGRLLDGQHRLSAIVQSGVSASMAVVRGCDEAAYEVLDSGARRSVSDVYDIDRAAAAVAAFLTRFLSGKLVTRKQIHDTYAVIETDLNDVMAATARHSRTFSTGPIRAAALVSIRNGQSRRYVLSVLHDLCAWRFSELPAVANSFVRFKQNGKTTLRIKVAPDAEEFIRALSIFDERLKDNTKVAIRDIETRLASVKELTETAVRNPAYRL